MANQVTTIRGGLVMSAGAGSATVDHLDVRFSSDGWITEVGPNLQPVADEVVIDAGSMVVMPGMVDSHRHPWQALMRCVSTDQTVVEYRSLARGRLAARYRPEDVYAAILLSDLEAINGGVTAISDLAHIMNSPEHADAAIQAHVDSGLRVLFCHGEPNDLEVDAWYHNSSRKHPDDVRRLRDDVLRDDDARVTLGMKVRPPFLVTPEVLRYDFELARELDLHVAMDGGLGGGCWTGARWGDDGLVPIEDIRRIGQLGPHLTLVHCNNLTDSDFALIAESGTHVSISPDHEMLCGHGLPATIRMRHHDLEPALSTDSLVAVSGDMFGAMRSLLAATRGGISDAAYRSGEAVWSWEITSEDVFRSATQSSAAACGLGDKIGSLEPGKRADIVLLKSDPFNLTLLNNPIANVVTSAHPGNVDTVIINGEVMKSGGALAFPDVNAVVDAAERSRAHIFAETDLSTLKKPQVDKWAMFA
ncbi:amidohydrolase family protein [Kribbella sp. NPDC050820]|uniref:amidohydrolase family protein n=1 Tax=Kribbella sp. NPDC050820 TaxID=3155408 RepID=UPI0033E8487F